MINESIQFTQEQFLQCHSINTIPNLIVLYILTSLIFLAVGFMVVKHSRKKIFLIWLYSVIFSGLILAFLIFMPNLTQVMINGLMGGLK